MSRAYTRYTSSVLAGALAALGSAESRHGGLSLLLYKLFILWPMPPRPSARNRPTHREIQSTTHSQPPAASRNKCYSQSLSHPQISIGAGPRTEANTSIQNQNHCCATTALEHALVMFTDCHVTEECFPHSLGSHRSWFYLHYLPYDSLNHSCFSRLFFLIAYSLLN